MVGAGHAPCAAILPSNKLAAAAVCLGPARSGACRSTRPAAIAWVDPPSRQTLVGQVACARRVIMRGFPVIGKAFDGALKVLILPPTRLSHCRAQVALYHNRPWPSFERRRRQAPGSGPCPSSPQRRSLLAQTLRAPDVFRYTTHLQHVLAPLSFLLHPSRNQFLSHSALCSLPAAFGLVLATLRHLLLLRSGQASAALSPHASCSQAARRSGTGLRIDTVATHRGHAQVWRYVADPDILKRFNAAVARGAGHVIVEIFPPYTAPRALSAPEFTQITRERGEKWDSRLLEIAVAQREASRRMATGSTESAQQSSLNARHRAYPTRPLRH